MLPGRSASNSWRLSIDPRASPDSSWPRPSSSQRSHSGIAGPRGWPPARTPRPARSGGCESRPRPSPAACRDRYLRLRGSRAADREPRRAACAATGRRAPKRARRSRGLLRRMRRSSRRRLQRPKPRSGRGKKPQCEAVDDESANHQDRQRPQGAAHQAAPAEAISDRRPCQRLLDSRSRSAGAQDASGWERGQKGLEGVLDGPTVARL